MKFDPASAIGMGVGSALTIIIQFAAVGDDSQQAPLSELVSHMLEGQERIESPAIFAACEKSPRDAVVLFRNYVNSPRREVRCLAIEVLCRYNLEENLSYIVPALAEPIDTAVRAIGRVNWTTLNEDVRADARRHLRHWTDHDYSGCAKSLGMIGTVEDVPCLESALERAILGKVEFEAPVRRVQERWERTHEGISPVEANQLDLRQALATLGVPAEIQFFRERLLGNDQPRVLDALERSMTIRRPELLDGIARWLPGADWRAPGGPSDFVRASPSFLAVQALEALYPGIGPQVGWKERHEFWVQWASEHEMTSGYNTEDDIEQADDRRSQGNTASGRDARRDQKQGLQESGNDHLHERLVSGTTGRMMAIGATIVAVVMLCWWIRKRISRC